MLTVQQWAECFHQMVLVPLAFLAWRTMRGHRLDVAWWWLAGAFWVSWLADTAADFLPREYVWVPSLAYPISQTAVIAFVLLPRRIAATFSLCLVSVAVIVVLSQGADAPDLVLRSVAWLSIVAMVWIVDIPPRLRACLLVYFGLGLALWMVLLRWLVLPPWFLYQTGRFVGLMLFCWAATIKNGQRVSVT